MAKPNPRAVPRRFQRVSGGTGPVDQSALPSTDINRLIAQAHVTGLPPASRPAAYGDFSAADFSAAQDYLLQVRTLFGSFSASVRSRFDHDPHVFLRALDDPAMTPTLIHLGIYPPQPPKPAPTPVPAPLKADSESQPVKYPNGSTVENG